MSSVRIQPRVIISKLMAAIPCNATLNLNEQVTTLIQKTMGMVAQQAFQATQLKFPLADTLKSASVIQQEAEVQTQKIAHQISSYNLSQVEAAKVEAFSKVASSPFLLSFTTSPIVTQQFKALQQAATLPETQAAQSTLFKTLESNHNQLFVETIAKACSNAAGSIGFTKIEVSLGPLGSHRVIATDNAGRSLISEISADVSKPNLSTEVFGVSDGSCKEILNKFEAALEGQGISGTSERKWTGGVLELAAAREFVKRKIKPATQKVIATSTNTNTDTQQRTQKLNNQNRQKQR